MRQYRFYAAFGTDDDHTNSHIERSEHLVVGYVAELLHNTEDREFGPRAPIDLDRHAIRQNARNIVQKAPSRNVSQAFYLSRVEQRADLLEKTLVRFQKGVTDGLAELLERCVGFIAANLEKQFSC